MANSIEASSQAFGDLVAVGSREESNVVTVPVGETETQVGVRVEQRGPKKAITMEVVVPTSRSERGSRRVTKVNLTGRQARQIYETLRSFYETRSEVEDETRVLWY